MKSLSICSGFFCLYSFIFISMVEELLKQKYGEYLEQLYISEKDDMLSLSAIVLNKEARNQGIGSKVMQDLITYADKHGKTIGLTPSSDYGGSKTRLTKFYRTFGFVSNKGSNKDFRFRDTMIREPKGLNESTDNIPGGLADGMTLKDIAIHHKVDMAILTGQLTKGIKVELEHTNSEEMAREIAMDHLYEDPKYYDKLEKVEESSIRTRIKQLLYENVKLSVTDETPLTTAFNLFSDGDLAGFIEVGRISPKMAEDTLEIVGLKVNPKFRGKNIGKEAVDAIWDKYPQIERLAIMATDESRPFWNRIGAHDAESGYMEITRAKTTL